MKYKRYVLHFPLLKYANVLVKERVKILIIFPVENFIVALIKKKKMPYYFLFVLKISKYLKLYFIEKYKKYT